MCSRRLCQNIDSSSWRQGGIGRVAILCRSKGSRQFGGIDVKPLRPLRQRFCLQPAVMCVRGPSRSKSPMKGLGETKVVSPWGKRGFSNAFINDFITLT
jgi:hypothetical protein